MQGYSDNDNFDHDGTLSFSSAAISRARSRLENKSDHDTVDHDGTSSSSSSATSGANTQRSRIQNDFNHDDICHDGTSSSSTSATSSSMSSSSSTSLSVHEVIGDSNARPYKLRTQNQNTLDNFFCRTRSKNVEPALGQSQKKVVSSYQRFKSCLIVPSIIGIECIQI